MPEPQQKKTRVLVVDDEKDVCDIMGDFLRDKNYEVFTALTKEAGVDILEKFKPEIALLDVRLKGASGLDILRRARELYDDIIVVMITALDDAETVKESKNLGADDYIVKPLTLEYLENVVLRKISLISFRKKTGSPDDTI